MAIRWFTISAAKTRRNDEIVAKRLSGDTLRQLALEYGISYERVRMIIQSYKIRTGLPLERNKSNS